MTTAPKGALSLMARAGMLGQVEYCPHPDRLKANAILAHGWRRDMVLCQECLRTFQELTAGYGAHSIGPREVVARLLALGYTRTDAARFLLELVALRLRVRLGFARWPQ
jgi:hypothetical protein